MYITESPISSIFVLRSGLHVRGGHGQSLYGQIDRRMIYGTIRYGQYGVCAVLIKSKGTSVISNVPLVSHNPINGGN